MATYIFDRAAEIAGITAGKAGSDISSLVKELENKTGTAVDILKGQNFSLITVFYNPPRYTRETQILPNASIGHNLKFSDYSRQLGLAGELGLRSGIPEEDFSSDEMQLLSQFVNRLGGTVGPNSVGDRLIIDIPNAHELPNRLYVWKRYGRIETDADALANPLARKTITFVASNLFGYNLPPNETAKPIGDELGKAEVKSLMEKWKNGEK